MFRVANYKHAASSVFLNGLGVARSAMTIDRHYTEGRIQADLRGVSGVTSNKPTENTANLLKGKFKKAPVQTERTNSFTHELQSESGRMQAGLRGVAPKR